MSTETKPLIPYLQALHEAVEALAREAETVTACLTDAQWNWSPAPDRWSIALCLEHLNKVGYSVLPPFAAALAQLKARDARSDGPFRYSAFERWVIRLLSPNPPLKLPVPPSFVPTAAPDPKMSVLPKFLTLQAELLRFIEATNGFDLKKIKVTSPAIRFFRMTLGSYLESTVTHEQYHWLQAKAVRAHLQFPLS